MARPSRAGRAERRDRRAQDGLDTVTAMRRLLPHLVPVAMILAVVLGVALVLRRPSGLLTVVLAVMLVVPALWIGISALWPARADRTCPRCGADALERLDPETTTGVSCRACGWVDETASAWLLAEEEGPLEDAVLRQRGRLPSSSGKRRGPAVDSPRAAD